MVIRRTLPSEFLEISKDCAVEKLSDSHLQSFIKEFQVSEVSPQVRAFVIKTLQENGIAVPSHIFEYEGDGVSCSYASAVAIPFGLELLLDRKNELRQLMQNTDTTDTYEEHMQQLCGVEKNIAKMQYVVLHEAKHVQSRDDQKTSLVNKTAYGAAAAASVLRFFSNIDRVDNRDQRSQFLVESFGSLICAGILTGVITKAFNHYCEDGADVTKGVKLSILQAGFDHWEEIREYALNCMQNEPCNFLFDKPEFDERHPWLKWLLATLYSYTLGRLCIDFYLDSDHPSPTARAEKYRRAIAERLEWQSSKEKFYQGFFGGQELLKKVRSEQLCDALRRGRISKDKFFKNILLTKNPARVSGIKF